MGNKPQLYKFSDIEHRLQTLEPGQTYIKPFVTSKVSDTMCGGCLLYTSPSPRD